MTRWVDYKVTSPQLDDPASSERTIFLSRLTGRSTSQTSSELLPYMVVCIERNSGDGRDIMNGFMAIIRTGLRMAVSWEGRVVKYSGDPDRYVMIPISHPFNPCNANYSYFKDEIVSPTSYVAPRPKNRGVRALEDIPGGGNALTILKQALGPNFVDLFNELPPAEVMRQYLLRAGYASDPQSVIALASALYPDRVNLIGEGDVLSGIERLEIDGPEGERIIIDVYQSSVITDGRTLQISSSGIASTVATKANKKAPFD